MDKARSGQPVAFKSGPSLDKDAWNQGHWCCDMALDLDTRLHPTVLAPQDTYSASATGT